MTKTLDSLRPTAWIKPDNYGGFSPNGDYCILTIARDSCALDRSNWHIARQLLADSAGLSTVPFSDSGPVYEWRAGHWGCGWIEYLMVSASAPECVLECAASIVDSLADHPALCDDHWSELEWEECAEYWQSLDTRERVQLIKDSGSDASIFAARHDYLPSDNGEIQQWVMS